MFPGSVSQLLPTKPKLKTNRSSSPRVIICITNRAPSFAFVYGLSTWGLRSSENFKSFRAMQPLRDLQRLGRNFVLRKKFWFARQRWPTFFVRENRSLENEGTCQRFQGCFVAETKPNSVPPDSPSTSLRDSVCSFLCVPRDKVFWCSENLKS